MQVPRFSLRISLIEMTPRLAPCSGCPGRPALPYLVCHHRQTPQGTGSDWKNLPGTAHTDTIVALIYRMGGVEKV